MKIFDPFRYFMRHQPDFSTETQLALWDILKGVSVINAAVEHAVEHMAEIAVEIEKQGVFMRRKRYFLLRRI